MSNIRFLDNVAVSSYQSSQVVGAAFPRVVFAGEIRIVETNSNSYAYDVYNLGTIYINTGVGVVIGGQTVYAYGLLRVENILENQGTINIDGILELGDITN